MTLQDWSNFAQVIGAIAVVISLFYVGFQIKRNTSAVRSATAQAIHNNYADWYMNLMGDAELNRIALKGVRDYASLDDIEKAQFIETFMGIYLFFAERLLPVAQKGVISLALGWLGIARHEFSFCSWRKRVLEGTRLRFREGILGLCGESHHDEEATSRCEALWRLQDRLMETKPNQAMERTADRCTLHI